MSNTDLYHGDCLEVMPTLAAGSVDMVLADPPYGTTQCKWDSVIPLHLMWAELKRVIKPKGAIVLTAAQPFTTTLIHSNMSMFKYCWIWEKSQATGHLNAWRMPMKAAEDVVVFAKGLTLYNPILTNKAEENIRPITSRTKGSDCYGNHDLDAHRCPPDKSMPKTIIKFNNNQGGLHPTQKPVALMEYMVKTYTNEGETVLDFTMGSGTTGIACQNLNREFIGIEKDADYFRIAQDRLNANEAA